jgi:hypothetical protein
MFVTNIFDYSNFYISYSTAFFYLPGVLQLSPRHPTLRQFDPLHSKPFKLISIIIGERLGKELCLVLNNFSFLNSVFT